MKAKLPLAILVCSVASFAQSPIQEYYGHLDGGPGSDGNSHRNYFVVTSATPIDQSPSGANATWTFDQLTEAGISEYNNQIPTADELTNYPGTEIVTTNTVTMGPLTTTSTAYFSTDSGTAFTGAQNDALQLTYDNNALVGTFPMSFGDSSSDGTSGTFSAMGISGTFTGTITSSVDAFGTLTINPLDGQGISSFAVTRLMTVQMLDLNYSPFGTIGTATITTYHYYRPDLAPAFPYFTSATTAVNVPLLAIDQSTEVLEVAFGELLGTPQHVIDKVVQLAPNPAIEILNIHSPSGYPISSIEISDNNGRILLQNAGNNSIATGTLASGVYFATITTTGGKVTKKFIKK